METQLQSLMLQKQSMTNCNTFHPTVPTVIAADGSRFLLCCVNDMMLVECMLPSMFVSLIVIAISAYGQCILR